MNVAIVGFGYIVPKGFYNITSHELAVFEGTEMILVTFAQKHIILGDFDGKSVQIGNDITPNYEEIQLINREFGSQDIPTLQLFTTTIGGTIPSELLDPVEPIEPVEDVPIPPDPTTISPETLLRQQQDEEYQLALAIDRSIQDIHTEEVPTPMTITIRKDPLLRPVTAITSINPRLRIRDQFKIMAYNIINGMVLVIGDTSRYRIVEVEFYYNHPKNHSDHFTHGDEMQKNFGTWYFHRQGNSYRGGTYKGLDIVFGTPEYYGGILIRSIQSIDDGRLISGPSCCVDTILQQSEYQCVADLAASFNLWVDNKEGPLYLDTYQEEPPDRIYQSIRVGLSLKKHPNPDLTTIKFLMAPYRYLIKTDPTSISKGRPNLIAQMIRDEKSIMEIVDVSGSRKSTVIKYASEFSRGQKLNTILDYGGKTLKSEDICVICGWYSRKY